MTEGYEAFNTEDYEIGSFIEINLNNGLNPFWVEYEYVYKSEDGHCIFFCHEWKELQLCDDDEKVKVEEAKSINTYLKEFYRVRKNSFF